MVHIFLNIQEPHIYVWIAVPADENIRAFSKIVLLGVLVESLLAAYLHRQWTYRTTAEPPAFAP